MRGGDDDAERIGYSHALLMTIEGTRATMHGRSQHVGLQAQQQFANLGIGLRAYIAQLTFEIGRSPRHQPPVFVVDEDTTILDRRLSRHEIVAIDSGLWILMHWNIGPPIPWRDPDTLRHIIDAVDGASHIAAGYHQAGLSLGGDGDDVVLPAPFQVGCLQQPLGNQV